MASIFTVVWRRLLAPSEAEGNRARRRIQLDEAAAGSAFFLVLRRMRAPLIVLIVIYAISVLGLTLITGVDAQGKPWSMGFFHAFYFMSYTATTIGFGELPYGFTDAQRMWVTFCIYLTVIGWAYAVGTLLGLLQDRGFRQALAVRGFARRVRRIRETYFLIAGYGQAGRLVGRALDARRVRFVVIDAADVRVDELALTDYRTDVPALAADAANPAHLQLAGIMRPDCIGVFALTDDEAVNLAVATAARLLRPDLRVVARCATRPVAERLKAIGTHFVVNPYDRFGDFLTLAIRGPATFRLMEWLTGTPGSELPPRREPPRGRWVVCGYGRFGREVTGDLERAGMEVTIIEKERQAVPDPRIIEGSGIEAEVLDRAGVASAVGLVAATDNDTSNLTVITAARKRNPDLYIVARQNRQVNAELYQAIAPDFLAVLSRVIAQECLAPLTTPLLVRFLDLATAEGDASSARLIARLEERCGRRVPIVWAVGLNPREAPAIARLLARPGVTLALGDLLRDPAERARTLPVVPLMIVRGDTTITAPADDVAVLPGDEILLAGRGEARNRLRGTLYRDPTRDYVLTGRYAPAGWLWRQLARTGDSGALIPPRAS